MNNEMIKRLIEVIKEDKGSQVSLLSYKLLSDEVERYMSKEIKDEEYSIDAINNLRDKFISKYNYFIEANYFYSVLEIKMICNTLDNSEINNAFDSLLESIK